MVIYLAALTPCRRTSTRPPRWTAPALAQFRKVTIPMISPALFFTLILQTIAALQMFNEAYTMFFGGHRTAPIPTRPRCST